MVPIVGRPIQRVCTTAFISTNKVPVIAGTESDCFSSSFDVRISGIAKLNIYKLGIHVEEAERNRQSYRPKETAAPFPSIFPTLNTGSHSEHKLWIALNICHFKSRYWFETTFTCILRKAPAIVKSQGVSEADISCLKRTFGRDALTNQGSTGCSRRIFCTPLRS